LKTENKNSLLLETKNIFNLYSEKLDDHPLGEAGTDDLTAPVPGQSLIVIVMVVG